jgi:hypothetical protein
MDKQHDVVPLNVCPFLFEKENFVQQWTFTWNSAQSAAESWLLKGLALKFKWASVRVYN